MAQQDKPIHALLYGSAGAGKSILALTFPKCLYFDFDKGTTNYEDYFPQHKFVRGENILYKLNKAIKMAMEGTLEYETIVIDSLTNLENLVVQKFKNLDIDKWDRNLYTSNQKKLEYTDWSNLSGSTISLFNQIRTLKINVVIITQVDTQEVNSKVRTLPSLVGKAQMESLHFADIVGYLEKTEEGRRLHLYSDEAMSFYAKARSVGGDIEPIFNPNYEKLRNALTAKELNLKF